VTDPLNAILSEMPALGGAPTVSPLAGGITNRNYRVEAADRVYVLRIAGEYTSALGIDRDREHACAKLAAELGIGAEIVCYLPRRAAMLTRFVEGRVLSAGDAHGDVLARVAAALVRLHSAAAVPGLFSAFAVIRDYQRLARERGVPLPAELEGIDAELESIERRVGSPARSCPCHNDLLPANLIDDGLRIRIIDWEYAGMGDRFFDLGNFAENNRLTPDEETDLLRLYFGEVRADDVSRLRTMRRVSALREAMWGFAQAGISQLDFDFLGYADEHLHRFQHCGAVDS
jgi:thiamine kinase-like enzyme